MPLTLIDYTTIKIIHLPKANKLATSFLVQAMLYCTIMVQSLYPSKKFFHNYDERIPGFGKVLFWCDTYSQNATVCRC